MKIKKLERKSDGVNINPDRNITKTSSTCCECGHTWGSELTLFKKFFKPCDHEYKYFHCEAVPRNSFVHSFQHKFSFICTKCEKVISVTEDELRADYEAYQKEVDRRNAIGKPYDLEPTTLTFKLFGAGLIQFNGVACTLLMNKYKFLKLKEIEPPRHPH